MKLISAILLVSVLCGCGLDMGRQSEVYNSKDVFARHEQNLHLTDIKP